MFKNRLGKKSGFIPDSISYEILFCGFRQRVLSFLIVLFRHRPAVLVKSGLRFYKSELSRPQSKPPFRIELRFKNNSLVGRKEEQAEHVEIESEKSEHIVRARRKSQMISNASPVSSVSLIGIGGKTSTDLTSLQIFSDLCADINLQRKLLIDNASMLSEFNLQWGFTSNRNSLDGRVSPDPIKTQEISTASDASDTLTLQSLATTKEVASSDPCNPWFISHGKTILRDIATVRSHVKEEVKMLQIATDQQSSMELLHAFILDILGRDSQEARIFESHVKQEYRHAQVTTLFAKRRSWALVLALNAFFVYYALLKGSIKGAEWQRLYCLACLIQFIVEMLLNEIMEVVWINLISPSLIHKNVSAAVSSLEHTVASMCEVHGLNENDQKD
jgi:hypothetical protein